VSSRGRSKKGGIPGIVLAAGKGTRMKMPDPKPAVLVGGRAMGARVVDVLRRGGVSRIVAVVGHRGDDVRKAIGDGVEYIVQEEQHGTGHATARAEQALAGYQGPVVVAYGDLPLLTDRDVRALLRRHLETDAAATLLTAVFENPGTLGRILRNEHGGIAGIVEARDATAEQLEIKEINVGVYCFTAPLLFEVLAHVTNDNAQKQYYLTDTIGILTRRGERIEGVAMERAEGGLGVDTEEDLERARSLSACEDPG